MSFVIQVTHQNEVEFVRPKFYTGKMCERWPELLSNPERAKVYESREPARDALSYLRSLGYGGEVVNNESGDA